MSLGKIRINTDRLLEFLLGALDIVLLLEREPEVIVGNGGPRVAPQDATELLNCLGEVAHPQIREPYIHHGRHVVRIGPEHPFKLLDPFRGATGFHQHEPVVVPRLVIGWVQFNRLPIGFQRSRPVSRFL